MKKFWFEEHKRGNNILLVILHGDPKGAAMIRGSFEVESEEEAVVWQKILEGVNSTLQS